MKTLISLLLIIMLGYAPTVYGQCNPDALNTACISKLPSGFNFLKSYRIDGQGKDKVEYSYVFTKGTQYMINLCPQNENSGTIVITVYDSQRNKVASNKVNGTVATAIAYPCNATGIYYFQYTFEGDPNPCAGSALGFKK